MAVVAVTARLAENSIILAEDVRAGTATSKMQLRYRA
jgi:hypothetical protein